MKARHALVRLGYALTLATCTVGLQVVAQTPPVLNLQLYAGLSITGAVGAVYSIEYVTDLTQTLLRQFENLRS
jgi:hypothetical protein